jgi:hypothetical protein
VLGAGSQLLVVHTLGVLKGHRRVGLARALLQDAAREAAAGGWASSSSSSSSSSTRRLAAAPPPSSPTAQAVRAAMQAACLAQPASPLLAAPSAPAPSASWLYAYTEAGLERALRLYCSCGMAPVARVEGWGCADEDEAFGDVEACVELLAWLGPGGGLGRATAGAAEPGGLSCALPLLRRGGGAAAAAGAKAGGRAGAGAGSVARLLARGGEALGEPPLASMALPHAPHMSHLHLCCGRRGRAAVACIA